ncbi:unnamed protein product [Closterium sp. NIES-54]
MALRACCPSPQLSTHLPLPTSHKHSSQIPPTHLVPFSQKRPTPSFYHLPLPCLPPHPAVVTVCYGMEWHRFPTSFLLPSPLHRTAFINDGFKGLLPIPFDPEQGGTESAPNYFNDRNQATPEQFLDESLCDYLVELDNSRHVSMTGERGSILEGADALRGHDEDEWERDWECKGAVWLTGTKMPSLDILFFSCVLFSFSFLSFSFLFFCHKNDDIVPFSPSLPRPPSLFSPCSPFLLSPFPQVLASLPFVDAQRSPALYRAFFIPSLSERLVKYGSYALLRRKQATSRMEEPEEDWLKLSGYVEGEGYEDETAEGEDEVSEGVAEA